MSKIRESGLCRETISRGCRALHEGNSKGSHQSCLLFQSKVCVCLLCTTCESCLSHFALWSSLVSTGIEYLIYIFVSGTHCVRCSFGQSLSLSLTHCIGNFGTLSLVTKHQCRSCRDAILGRIHSRCQGMYPIRSHLLKGVLSTRHGTM